MDLDELLTITAAPIYARMVGSGSMSIPRDETERMMKQALREAYQLWILSTKQAWRNDIIAEIKCIAPRQAPSEVA